MPKWDLDAFTLARFRQRLAHVDALPQLALLGVFCGALTGIVMLAFRGAIELPLSFVLPGNDSENFEDLPMIVRFLLPVLGGLAIGFVVTRLRADTQSVGVVHVMERLSRHQGHLPLRNALLQFFGGALALICGHSSGREGPAIHLGAASSSLLGQALELPNNSIRTLVGCGTAAAIAASFNTPIAGVIFAMEVVMMEYSIASFIPVILTAVTATLLTRMVYGAAPAFSVPELGLHSLWEIPFVTLLGLVAGTLGALFVRLTRYAAELPIAAPWQRITLAGVLTGTVALVVPQVMGIGYDTVNAALLGEIGLATLVLIMASKLVVTACSVGLGVPAGLIGPTLVIGAALGGSLWYAGVFFSPDHANNPGFYVLLGMGAMMGGALQAPLAALMAILELTANPGIILPAMLAIVVVAAMTASELLATRSVFIMMLEARGLRYRADPLTLALQKVGVSVIMERRVARLDADVTAEAAQLALKDDPRWIVITRDNAPTAVLNAADLARELDELEHSPEADGEIQLLEIPGLRMDVVSVDQRATLQEAREQVDESGVEAVCITRMSAPGIVIVVGVLTRQDIDDYYRFSR
ncbi:MAG: chloride channel protein [Gammaproteobacteria bacterium]